MRFLFVNIILVASLATVTVTGHSHHVHHQDHHGHGGAVSYAMVTKHEDHHGGDNGHHHHHHAVHHGHHGHGHVEHHGHQVSHDHGYYYGGHHVHQGHFDHHGPAKYDFKYGVKDPKTGDMKNQWESRDGDSVKGEYSLKESDGTTRIVKYSADKKKGFEATVHKIGHAHSDHGHHENHVYHGHHGHATSFTVIKRVDKH